MHRLLYFVSTRVPLDELTGVDRGIEYQDDKFDHPIHMLERGTSSGHDHSVSCQSCLSIAKTSSSSISPFTGHACNALNSSLNPVEILGILQTVAHCMDCYHLLANRIKDNS
ncbi:hypothetical protein FRC03_003271 [Tulasnella sp. 419]|nr:hypothetical protein FRC03_003271 [Tulasnella sp. 419]